MLGHVGQRGVQIIFYNCFLRIYEEHLHIKGNKAKLATDITASDRITGIPG